MRGSTCGDNKRVNALAVHPPAAIALNLERGFRKNGDGEFVQVPEAVVGQRVFILAKKLLGERRTIVRLVSLGVPRVNRPGETGRA